MLKSQVNNFNQAFSFEPTKEQAQLVSDMLAVWAKLDTAASKTPATLRKGILFGLGLAEGLAAGKISLPPVKEKAAKKATQGQP